MKYYVSCDQLIDDWFFNYYYLINGLWYMILFLYLNENNNPLCSALLELETTFCSSLNIVIHQQSKQRALHIYNVSHDHIQFELLLRLDCFCCTYTMTTTLIDNLMSIMNAQYFQDPWEKWPIKLRCKRLVQILVSRNDSISTNFLLSLNMSQMYSYAWHKWWQWDEIWCFIGSNVTGN